MTIASLPVRVAALYRFTPFNDPAAMRVDLLSVCQTANIRGTLLLAHEGINGTIAGTPEGIEQVLTYLRTLPGCADLAWKESSAETLPFKRMKVRLKREIVTMGQPSIDPRQMVGRYVAPAAWNALMDDPDTVLIDTRNDYEVVDGTFDGAIDPRIKTFREFPDWFRANRPLYEADGKQPKYAMFCTGGIRCEKATAFLRAEGIDEVYHLEGGILKYLEQVPADESRWQGECFVFDEREAIGQGLQPRSKPE